MNPTLCALATAAILSTFQSGGMAQSSTDESAPPPRRNPPPRLGSRGNLSTQQNLTPLLDALDINHDGVIDPEELANASSALEALDGNDDGQLTVDEYSTPTRSGRPPGRFGPRRFPGRPVEASAPEGGLANFALVDTHVLRGAQPGAAGIQTLKELGVTSIVDLTLPDTLGDAERSEASRQGILYLNFPMDPLARPSVDQVNATLAAITNSVGRVFVHCRAGRDRTGTVVACYRIAQCGWNAEEAVREANRFRMGSAAGPMRQFIADFGKRGAGSASPPPASAP